MYTRTTEVIYRGVKMVRFAFGNNNWVVYNAIGHTMGGAAGFKGQLAAEQFIDKYLGESPCLKSSRTTSPRSTK